MRIGLVSDTHGKFDPRLAELFLGCDVILHAGDIVDRATLDDLARLAPVQAVRGNNDQAGAFDDLPELAVVPLGEVTALLVHQIGGRARLLPVVRRAVATSRARILVHGHSHRPGAAHGDGLLVINPGSAGPRRFSLPRSAGLLELTGSRAVVRLHDLARPGLPLLAAPLAVDLGAKDQGH